MHPKEALEEYIESKKYSSEAEATIQNYSYRLKRFVEFCERAGIEEISDVTGRTAEKFRQARLKNPDVNPYTAEQQMRTFRQFLRWCESNGFVEAGTAEKVIIPNSDAPDRVRNEAISAERANEIVDWLNKYEYATRKHIVFHTLWETSMRIGSLRALDVYDFRDREEEGSPVLGVRHRPEAGTPLKQKEEGQRNITVTDDRLVEAIHDWVEKRHPKVEDEHGRMPLIGTSHGRAHLNTIRSDIYRVVQPCRYRGSCPHNKIISECEYRENDSLSGCPSSIYPHAIRSGAITAHLNEDIPKEIVSERANTSEGVLEQHYDERTLEEKRKRRERYL